MSEDLIRRSDAISKTLCISFNGTPRMVVPLDDIKAIPSVDRPQGYWIKVDVATYRCSECGKKQIADDVNELNFCCCCGSRNKLRYLKGADDDN